MVPRTLAVRAELHLVGLAPAVDEQSEVDAPRTDGLKIESVDSAVGFEIEFDGPRSHAQTIAALATIDGDRLMLRAAVGRAGGAPPVLAASMTDTAAEAKSLVTRVLHELIRQGALSLLGR